MKKPGLFGLILAGACGATLVVALLSDRYARESAAHRISPGQGNIRSENAETTPDAPDILPGQRPEPGTGIGAADTQKSTSQQDGANTSAMDGGLGRNGGETDGDPSGAPDNAWPENIEGLIWEYFAHQPGLELTSIISVDCDPRTCEIAFTGTDVNPQYVDEFSGIFGESWRWNATQTRLTTKQIYPGVRVFVATLSNVPIDPPRRSAELAEE